ncbi:MAG: hypothetical protein EXS17_00055 [Phycisphaerales bacterium]|nr:hypothetical protein [Phycisphaerales bacterium]
MAGTAGTYELGRFSGVCALSQQPILASQEFVAALVDALDGEGRPMLQRFDFAAEVWDQGARPDALVCFWRSLAPEPGDRKQTFVDDETLLEMVQRMGDETDARRRGFRWILALVLLRRKIIRLDGIVHDDEVEYWTFRPRGSDPSALPIRVANPGVRADEMRELADQLGEVIRTDS